MGDAPEDETDDVADDLVILRTYEQPADAEMLGEALRDSGIPAAVQGAQLRGMLTTLAGGFVPVRVLVPRSRVEEAAELADALDQPPDDSDSRDADGLTDEHDDAAFEAQSAGTSETAEPEPPRAPEPGAPIVGRLSGPGPYRDPGVSVPSPPAPRRRLLALLLSFVFPGGANLYAGHHVLGGTLALTVPFSIVWGGLHAVWPALAIVVLTDLVSGQMAVARANAGRPLSLAPQAAAGLVVFLATATIVRLIAFR